MVIRVLRCGSDKGQTEATVCPRGDTFGFPAFRLVKRLNKRDFSTGLVKKGVLSVQSILSCKTICNTFCVKHISVLDLRRKCDKVGLCGKPELTHSICLRLGKAQVVSVTEIRYIIRVLLYGEVQYGGHISTFLSVLCLDLYLMRSHGEHIAFQGCDFAGGAIQGKMIRIICIRLSPRILSDTGCRSIRRCGPGKGEFLLGCGICEVLDRRDICHDINGICFCDGQSLII